MEKFRQNSSYPVSTIALLGGVLMDNKMVCRYSLMCVFIAVASIAMANIDFACGRFALVVPWIFFCFLNNKLSGIIAFSSITIVFGFVNKLFFLIMIVVLFSILFVKHVLRFNNRKMEIILGIYNFFVVLFCSFLQIVIEGNGLYFLPFIMGVISYWIMRYYCKLYFSFKGIEDTKLDSGVSSFVLVLVGIVLMGLDIDFGVVNLSYVLIVALTFIGVKIGFEVGAVYTLCVGLLMFLFGRANIDILFLGYSFLIMFFLSSVSRATLFFTYLAGSFLLLYYLGLDYLLVINYCIISLVFLLVPKSVINNICRICYGSDMYIKQVSSDNKKFNLEIANKIVRMEEVFSLVCEKLDVKERIKKNDKKLLIEEVNMFGDLLQSFSSDIKENYNFNCNYKMEKEFYKHGVDLLSFTMKENIFKDKSIELDVRCEKNEVKSFVVPLVNRIAGCQFEVSKVNYNDLFGYYSLSLQQKKRISFKYGVSQRSLNKKVCGDSYLVYENEHNYIFAISDGMGTGQEAKESSSQALDLFRKFMDIGFSLDQTLKSLNSVLRGKYSKDCYSTLDLFIYDKFNGKFYFCKNGASDSYLFNDNKLVFKGNNLPIGIVDKLDIEIKEVELKKGDCLVMLSDGVGEECLIEINKFKAKNPQKISELVIDKETSINDDKTVLVIKVC